MDSDIERVGRRIVPDGVSAAAPTASTAADVAAAHGTGTAARTRGLLRLFLKCRNGVENSREWREDCAHAHVEASVGHTGSFLHCGTGNLGHFCATGELDKFLPLLIDLRSTRFWFCFPDDPRASFMQNAIATMG